MSPQLDEICSQKAQSHSEFRFRRINKVSDPQVSEFIIPSQVAQLKDWKIDHFSNEHTKLAQEEILRTLNSKGPFGISTDRFPSPETFSTSRVKITYLHLVFTYSVSLAKQNKDDGNLRILDFGGGVGNHVHLLESLLPHINFSFSLVELEANLALATLLNPQISTHRDLSTLETFDFVHLGSSLQYCRNYDVIIKQLTQKEPSHILFTRTPTSLGPTVAFRSKNSFMHWVFSISDLIIKMKAQGYELVRIFDASDCQTYTTSKIELSVQESQILFRRSD